MTNPGQLDKGLPVPLYHQLKAILLEGLRRGRWKPNEQLPTEEALAAEFGVSKATVREALRDLALAGLVRREQGRGTFAAEAKIQFGPRELRSFTEEMRDSGLPVRSRVLEQKMVEAGPDVAERLRIPEGTPVFVLHRLRMAGEEPMGLETAHIPAALVPGFLELKFDAASLYETLEKQYGIAPDHASQKHFAVVVNREEAALLQVPESSPALGGERIAFCRAGRPLELTYSLMRGDRYQIQLKLVRSPVRL
ncbi:MAG: GntR family transcriptional regulator [Acidobacteriota bacterium]